MKSNIRLKIGLSFLVLGFMALHCTNPNLPLVQFLDPAQDSAYVTDAFPYALDVKVSVPLPGCGATTFPVDPASFTATLVAVVDGEAVSEVDVTAVFGSGTPNPQTGAYTWIGTVEVQEYSEFKVVVTIANTEGIGSNALRFRVEQPAADFPGGFFTMSVSKLTQVPSGCVIDQGLIGIIEGIVKTIPFSLGLPSGADILAGGNAYPIVIALPFPLGNVDATLSLDEANNDILIDGPEDYTINLTGVAPLPGFDCIITAAANGLFDDVDPDDLDGVLNISVTNVDTSPGGTCSLVAPSGECNLNVFIDAD